MPQYDKKRPMALILTIIFLVLLILTPAACNAKPPAADLEPAGEKNEYADFENENLDFIRSYEVSPDAARVRLSIAGTDAFNLNSKGALLSSDGDGTMNIAVDLSSLLGGGVSDLFTVEADIAVVNDNTDFYAVSGEITALNSHGSAVSTGVWSVYLAEKNPNIVRLQLSEPLTPGPHNMLILSKTVDNAAVAGLKQSNLLLLSMHFYDADGSPLPVDRDAKFNAPDGFGEPDRSNLTLFADERAIEGAHGSSNGWGQAVALLTEKNDGAIDANTLVNSVITVYYSSESPPELILQSWTDGKPDSAGWAKVAPARVNNSGSIAQFSFEDMVISFGTDDFEAFLDQLFVGDTGAELTVYSVTVAAGNGR